MIIRPLCRTNHHLPLPVASPFADVRCRGRGKRAGKGVGPSSNF
uniref:Uncharacterized protein n=1 Tax=Nymphaea colorata TaxID=210225 RepID=A0A5K0VJP6_9MAGN